MARILYVEFDDEITELVERIRLSGDDPYLVFVLPNRARVLQSVLNLRLLMQYSRSFMKRTSIVSGDPRVQQLARDVGFPVFASVAAHERGVQALPPAPERPPGGAAGAHLPGGGGGGPDDMTDDPFETSGAPAVAYPVPSPTGGSTVATPQFTLGGPAGAATAGFGAGTASAVAAAPPPRAAPPRPAPRPPLPPVLTPGPVRAGGSPEPHGPRGRRDLYLVAGAVFVVGLLLLFIVAPTAKVTIVLSATPVSIDRVVISGTADAVQAAKADHVLTQIVTDDVTETFVAKPTGQKTLPATAAKAQIVFVSAYPIPFCLIINPGTVLAGTGTVKFAAASTPQGTCITRDPTGASVAGVEVPGSLNGQPGAPSEAIDVVATTAGAVGNVAAGAISQVDPMANGCNPANYASNPPACSPSDFRVTNAAAASGGADQKTQTIASATDVTGFKSQVDQLTAQAESKAKADIPPKTGSSSFVYAMDPSNDGLTYSVQVTPALPAPGATFQDTTINVAVHAIGVLYDPATVKQKVTDALAQKASETRAGDSLLDSGRVVADPVVKQSGSDGQVVFNDSGSGFIGPQVNPTALKDSFAGKGKGTVRDLVNQQYGSTVQDVEVSQSIPWFTLPYFSGRIEVQVCVRTPQATC